MKVITLKRREFLAAATGVGVATIGLPFHGWGAEAVSDTKENKAKGELDKIVADHQAQGSGYLCIPRKDGELLRLMVKAIRAQNVLEIGTCIGTSAIWLALGLQETGGKLTTIELLDDRVKIAKANVARAGLSELVTFKQGDAHELVPRLDGVYDFVFVDADKAGQADYFNKLYPNKLAPGGLLICDNVISQRKDLQDYLDMITKHPDFDTIITSATMTDGLALSYRHRK